MYYDTDSVIYVDKPGLYNPPLGDYLGDLTNEINPKEGSHIDCFVSGGPKNYAYKLDTGKTCCKVRGFTLNFRNSQQTNFDSVVHMVNNVDAPHITITNPYQIMREPKTKKIKTKPLSKVCRVCYNKIVALDDFNTVRYGYHRS